AGRNASEGSIVDASAGSAIQPSPRLAIVMPSWVAAMYRSGADTARRTAFALRCPSAISWSMRVLRTVTIENSAATKKPLAHTSASTPARRHRISIRDLALGNRVIEYSSNRIIGLRDCAYPITRLRDYQITQ